MIAGAARLGFRERNPHMQGTTSTLRLLFGREPGTDRLGEQLFDGVHIFEGFALVNYLLCSAVREHRNEFGPDSEVQHGRRRGAAKSFSHPVMRRNCSTHFQRTLVILEPTVIIVQGPVVRAWLADALGIASRGPAIEQLSINGSVTDMLTFNNPSASGQSGWWGRSPNSRYLREVVAPTIKAFLQTSGPAA
jgi:hypothetical protein